METVLDIETTVVFDEDGNTNPSPFEPKNSIVSVGVLCRKPNGDVEKDYFVLNHKEVPVDPVRLGQLKQRIQNILDNTTLLIGHNLKFDMMWLFESGFTYNGKYHDTMITEYVHAQGQKIPLSLNSSCERHGVASKLDTLGEYLNKGVNVNEIPLAELVAYGEQDILSTFGLYESQCSKGKAGGDFAYMLPAIELMDELLPVLIDMERNGICIDLKELERVEQIYRAEAFDLTVGLKYTVRELMGHTPINLESPEHLSWVIYSRKVNDKKSWKEIFNLGSEIRGSVRKKKYPKRYSPSQFTSIVRANTTKLHKTVAEHCQVCGGKGKVQKYTKDNLPYKKEHICKTCDGQGFIYKETAAYAGLKLAPISSEYTAVAGFSTDKKAIAQLLDRPTLPDKAREFLVNLQRLNSVHTYLSTFVDGIKKKTYPIAGTYTGILHTVFNQCITATGRLSSTNPNFQNLPKGKTFPVRKVIISRFKGGKIASVDFKQLEFRGAAILSGCKQAKEDILNGVDVHVFTRDTMIAAGQPMDRDSAKSRTFKPLYGGIKGTPAEEAYFKAFLQKYSGIAAWQKSLEDQAVTERKIYSPSGRIYAFPEAVRLGNGSVKGHTQIKNYMVQGFATGDVTPIALIEIHKKLKDQNLKSLLILTVHDDITLDVHPDEVDLVIKILKDVFGELHLRIKERFNFEIDIPLLGDFSLGDNWLEKKEV